MPYLKCLIFHKFEFQITSIIMVKTSSISTQKVARSSASIGVKEKGGRGEGTSYRQKDLMITWIQVPKNFSHITGGLGGNHFDSL